MRNMSSWAIRNPIPPIMLFVLLTAVGLLSFYQMKITQMPDISVPIVNISVSQPGGAPTEIETQVTQKIEGAVAKVEACNNGFDAVPTWEDITAMVQINRVYNFTNKTKTASKWGVNIRFTITKNEGFEGEVSISGFGGAYE